MSRQIVIASLLLTAVALVVLFLGADSTRSENGDGGPAIEASINGPSAISTDANGNLYIAEMMGRRIRRVDAKTGVIKTVAGNGKDCCFEEGKAAITTTLFSPIATAVDRQGNLYIIDISAHVRVVDAVTGIATTVVSELEGVGADKPGTAPSLAKFESAYGLAFAPSGTLYVSGSDGKIYGVSHRAVTEFAGVGGHGYAGDNKAARQAQLNFPMGIAFNAGDLFIADYENCRIRRVDGASNVISTIAGTGECSSGGDGGRAIAATINHPSAIAVDGEGNVYVNDAAPACVRRIDSNTSLISSVPGTCELKAGKSGRPSGVAIDNAGNLYIAEFGTNVIEGSMSKQEP